MVSIFFLSFSFFSLFRLLLSSWRSEGGVSLVVGDYRRGCCCRQHISATRETWEKAGLRRSFFLVCLSLLNCQSPSLPSCDAPLSLSPHIMVLLNLSIFFSFVLMQVDEHQQLGADLHWLSPKIIVQHLIWLLDDYNEMCLLLLIKVSDSC